MCLQHFKSWIIFCMHSYNISIMMGDCHVHPESTVWDYSMHTVDIIQLQTEQYILRN